MTHFIAFNGDADGLCALQQLRLAERLPVTLITGVKRDIKLLERVPAGSGDNVTALDVSLDSNREAVLRLLANGAKLRYFDHHHAGEIPDHSGLSAHIDPSSDVCTSILVDRYLKGKFRSWAIVAAFGDNLPGVGGTMGKAAGISEADLVTLSELGICLNYNAYGDSVEDLHSDPALLAEQILPFEDPIEFARLTPVYARLVDGYRDDMDKARRLPPLRQTGATLVVLLPDQAWARRAIGILANELMQCHGDKALAILSPNVRGGFTVSIRVPAHSKTGADEFCRRFATGGGRKTAGGINLLPEADIDPFFASFEACFT